MNHERLCTVTMHRPADRSTASNSFRGAPVNLFCLPRFVVRSNGVRGDPSLLAVKLDGDNFWTVVPTDCHQDDLAEFDNPMTSPLLMDCLRYICMLERLDHKKGRDT